MTVTTRGGQLSIVDKEIDHHFSVVESKDDMTRLPSDCYFVFIFFVNMSTASIFCLSILHHEPGQCATLLSLMST